MPYEFHPPSTWSLALFVAILIFVWTSFLSGVYLATRSSRTTTIAFVLSSLWFALWGVAVHTGFVEAMPFPRLPIFAGLSLIIALSIGLSPLGRTLAHSTSFVALIAFQVFRLPLEIVLHDWSRTGTIPTEMTFNGQNLDIVTGILAILALLFVRTPLSKAGVVIAWCFNLIGFGLLLNVGRVAVMSSPLPFSWKLEHPLILAFYLPYAWIVPVAVTGALLGHIVLTRKLRALKR